MASFWDQGPPQDFNLGTFKPAPPTSAPIGGNYQFPGMIPGQGAQTNTPTYPTGWTPRPDPLASGAQQPIPSMPGSDFGMKSPDKAFPFALPADATGGMTSGTIGNGGGTQGPFNFGQFSQNSGILGGMPNRTAQQAGVAQQQGVTLGSTMFSGMVPMQSPDGQFQYVNSDHVPHYQSRGATIYNGSSYGSGNG